MVSLSQTVWEISLKDAVLTFKKRLQEHDKSLSFTSSVTKTKITLKNILKLSKVI